MGRSVLLALASLAVAVGAACDDGEPATDREFVADLCGATGEFQESLTAALEEASNETDPDAALESLVGPLEEFVEAFEDADPPPDLEQWHEEASQGLTAAIARFEDEKTLAALEGFGDSPVPDPPGEAKARLRAAAEDVEECEGVAFLKPD